MDTRCVGHAALHHLTAQRGRLSVPVRTHTPPSLLLSYVRYLGETSSLHDPPQHGNATRPSMRTTRPSAPALTRPPCAAIPRPPPIQPTHPFHTQRCALQWPCTILTLLLKLHCAFLALLIHFPAYALRMPCLAHALALLLSLIICPAIYCLCPALLDLHR